MCHHRGYEYLRERERTREESLDEERGERREPIRSVDRGDADVHEEDERTEKPEAAVPGPSDD